MFVCLFCVPLTIKFPLKSFIHFITYFSWSVVKNVCYSDTLKQRGGVKINGNLRWKYIVGKPLVEWNAWQLNEIDFQWNKIQWLPPGSYRHSKVSIQYYWINNFQQCTLFWCWMRFLWRLPTKFEAAWLELKLFI